MPSISYHSPAKINLMLSVHPRREDGFHELTSLVAQLDFGDELKVSLIDSPESRLVCDNATVPTDSSNLILRAAALFTARLGRAVAFEFELSKRIPIGAGLGGGSSNAAIALKAMNELSDSLYDQSTLTEMAAELGSDCPLFLQNAPSVMRGRGERIEALTSESVSRLRGQKLVLFRPDFAIETAWAYSQMVASKGRAYEAVNLAEERLLNFLAGGNIDNLLFNSFEAEIGRKYLAIPELLSELRANGHRCLMSGSGSCCFALVEEASEAEMICNISRSAWGDGIFFIETSIC